MDGSKETELVMAVLLYAVRCLLEGDQAALRDMNFGPKEIDALREMKLADLCGVESMRPIVSRSPSTATSTGR